MRNRVSYLLVKCSSKPLLVLSALLMNSSHIELEVEFRVVSSSSLPVNTPSRRALLLLPSKTWTEKRERVGGSIGIRRTRCAHADMLTRRHTTPTTLSLWVCHPPPVWNPVPVAECLCQAASGWSRCTRGCCRSNRGSWVRAAPLAYQSQMNHIQLEKK